MFSGLVDHAGLLALFLGIVALVLGSAWWMTRQRSYLFGIAGVVGLLALLWLLTRLIETDRMQVVHTVEAMAQAIDERKLDAFFQHVATSFGHAGMNRQEFRQYVESRLRMHKVSRFGVSKIVADEVSRQAGTGKAEFWIDVEGNWEGGVPPIRCVAAFVLESDAWRLNGFKLFLGNTSTEFGCRKGADEPFMEIPCMPRIVSLIASATEIVCALGAEDQLVGRSHECDYPPSIMRLPVCTAPKFDVKGSSSAIDQRVKSILQEATSVYRVHAELLRELRPEVIVTQSQCEVCAVSLRDVEQAVCTWLDSRPMLVALEPNAMADVWTDIAQVAEALRVPERGAELIRRLQARLTAIADRARAVPERPTVACIEWIDPLMAAGNWMPELVELAGGINLFGTAGQHAPWMTWEQLRQRDPEVIVALPCGLDLTRTRAEMATLTGKPDWTDLRAVRGGRVYVTDGNQFFNRPGPRLAESLEILAEMLHPSVFAIGHEGIGWQRL